MSRTVSDSKAEGVTSTALGPIRWMSPEAIRLHYSEKSDVWAFGVTCWECLTGDQPFNDLDLHQLAIRVREENFSLASYIPADCPKYLRKLLLKCWSADPKDRPTFSEIVEILSEVVAKEEKRSKRKMKKEELASEKGEAAEDEEEAEESDEPQLLRKKPPKGKNKGNAEEGSEGNVYSAFPDDEEAAASPKKSKKKADKVLPSSDEE